MADTKVYLRGARDRSTGSPVPDTNNNDGITVANEGYDLNLVLNGNGVKVVIPPPVGVSGDGSQQARGAAHYYIGRTWQEDVGSDYLQSDIAFPVFDLSAIPVDAIIKKIRLLLYVDQLTFNMNQGDTSHGDLIALDPTDSNNWFRVGALKFDWGKDYPYPNDGAWPDIGSSTARTKLYEQSCYRANLGPYMKGIPGVTDWWFHVQYSSVDARIVSNPADYGFENVPIDPVNGARNYLVVDIKPSEWPTIAAGTYGYYRLAIVYDWNGRCKSKQFHTRMFIRAGSETADPGANRSYLEVTYGPATATADAHASINVVTSNGIPVNVSAVAELRSRLEVFGLGGTLVPVTALSDMHAGLTALGFTPTYVDDLIVDMHAGLDSGFPKAPKLISFVMRNYRYSHMELYHGQQTIIAMYADPRIYMSAYFTMLVRTPLSVEALMTMSMTTANLYVNRIVTTHSLLLGSVEGSLRIRGEG